MISVRMLNQSQSVQTEMFVEFNVHEGDAVAGTLFTCRMAVKNSHFDTFGYGAKMRARVGKRVG